MKRKVYQLFAILLTGCSTFFIAELNKLHFEQSLFVARWDSTVKQFQNNDSFKSEERELPSRGLSTRLHQKDFFRAKVSSNEKHPVILVWTTSPFLEKRGIEFIASDEYGSCHVTMNRDLLNRSVAVVIFNNHLKLAAMDVPDIKTR